MIPTAPLAQIITCRKGHTFTDVLQRHTDAMQHKIDLVGADGTQGSVIFWDGANAFKAMLSAGEFQDRKRILQRRIESDRQFGIVTAPTRVSFETSGKSVEETRAVLMIQGTLTVDASPMDFFKELTAEDGGASMGGASASIAGVVAHVPLAGWQNKEAKKIGGLYLFVDQQSMDTFLASDVWAKARAETPWADVTVEQYTVPCNNLSAAA